MHKTSTFSFVNELAKSVGFDLVGVAKASHLSDEAMKLYAGWLSAGMHAGIQYLENHFKLKTNPGLVLEDCNSVIVFALNYHSSKAQKTIASAPLKISMYAQGIDYHIIIQNKLHQFLNDFLKYHDGKVRCFVDTGPVAERYFAVMSGLGVIGKNCCLITPQYGTHVFLAVCLTDIVFERYSEPTNHDICQNCTLCIDACPTGALNGNKTLDARKCIAYLTVEHKGAFSDQTPQWSNWIWGCDICQNVCPYNRSLPETHVSEFQTIQPIQDLMQGKADFQHFNTIFAKTSLRRGGKERIPRNISHIQKGNILSFEKM